ncbi:C-type lectin domain family 4 member M isoform X2 [Lates calcarifer]|uniref:C-type lectin domain family 4 member M isoform X2 n=1 Tax=Lates calcarifer TaxID=8187 RepID=A0AAJ8AYC5_LATCA|nr:C-type lectin domain family 4 member M isoform X2 [Lates calcarifer]
MDNRYKPDASARMRKLYRLAGVSLGLLFILQAALNISLRLTFHVTTPDFKGIIKNLTEEREELKRELNISDAKTSDSETMIKNLTEESDEMKRKLNISDARTAHFKAMIKNLTEEREELKRKLNIFDARTAHFKAMIKNLTEEREELKRKLNIFDNYIQQRWVYFKHSFYYISSTTKSWQDSRNDCLQRGADLVIINSKEEQEFMRQFKQRTWIGLTDRETEGTWRWVDGTLLNTSYWDTGEPNNHNNEDCGEIKLYDKENSWNDESCTLQNLWICEKMIN